jgi:hypothetical protein
MLNGDEQVVRVFEAVFEALLADNLYSLDMDSTPVTHLMPDDVVWKKIDGSRCRPVALNRILTVSRSVQLSR